MAVGGGGGRGDATQRNAMRSCGRSVGEKEGRASLYCMSQHSIGRALRAGVTLQVARPASSPHWCERPRHHLLALCWVSKSQTQAHSLYFTARLRTRDGSGTVQCKHSQSPVRGSLVRRPSETPSSSERPSYDARGFERIFAFAPTVDGWTMDVMTASCAADVR